MADGPSQPQADLGRLLPQPDPPLPLCLLLGQPAGAPLLLAVSTVTPTDDAAIWRREVVHHRLDPDGRCWWALDRTVFLLGATEVVEAEQYRSREGANLHRAPIRLPRLLRRGAWHHPLPGHGGRVCLAWSGTARLGTIPCAAAALLAVEGGVRRLQWLVSDLGEVSLGPAQGPPLRWLLCARQGARTWLAGIPDALLALPRQPLPAQDPAGPATRLL